jgi:plastocyanin
MEMIESDQRRRMKRIATFAVALTAGLSLTATSSGVTLPRLAGTVGPGFTIGLKKAGKKVTTLKPGRYTFVISDKSSSHNFHLTGPGVNKKTTVAETGSKTWTVTLRAGTYRFVCDPHASGMKGSFTVK